MLIIKPLLMIWGELVEALHGVNGFGNNVVELYAYRFVTYTPLIHGQSQEEIRNLWANGSFCIPALGKEAATAAYQIFAMFEETYDCTIEIGDRGNWEPISVLKGGYFDHRLHVKVTQNDLR